LLLTLAVDAGVPRPTAAALLAEVEAGMLEGPAEPDGAEA
jgi:hypothetical protein